MLRIDYPRQFRTGAARWVPSWRQVLGLFGLAVAACIAGFIALYMMIDVPQPNDVATAQTTVVYYADGKQEMGKFAEVNRELVNLDEIPDSLQKAVLAAEDRGFYGNEGISPPSIVRAMWNNLTGGETQGASTITQQYARNAYLSQDRTWERKIKEAILAVKLSRSQSKDELLQNYLNTIYFGRGAYGVQAASQAYFGKNVQNLDVAQSAVLAALIRGPSLYDPAEGHQAKQALNDRVFNYVIPGMVEQGWLSQSEADSIKRLPKTIDPQALNDYHGQTGYMLAMVRDELKSLGFDKEQIDTGGLRVTTTFDQQAEKAAESAAKTSFPPAPNKGVKMGMISVQPDTGEIKAVYGGKNWEKSQFNNATAPVPVGSTFKAFTIAAALENNFTLSSTFYGNSPFYVDGVSKPFYNQGGASYGSAISLLYATEQSVNTAFLDLTQQMGAQKVADSAHNAGLDTHNLDVSPQITLGSASYSPLAMASAYGTFAAQGMQTDPYTVLKVTDADGNVLYEAQPKSHRAFPADIANETTYDLSQVIQNGTGAYAQNLGRPAAGKTGNHEGKTAWFIGYTPQLVTAVAFHRELGKEKLAPLNYVAGMPVFTGAGYPTQIWTAFMSAALEGMQVAPLPPRPTPSVAPTPTYTPTPTPSPTPSPKPSPSETPKPSPSETPKPSPSPSESKSPSPSQEPSKPGTGGGNPGTGGTGGGNP